MDAAGNNRYQLLFMDEDAVPTTQPEKVVKKKQSNVAAENSAPKKNVPAKKKESSNNEKENKANAINERVAKKPNTAGGNRPNKVGSNDGKPNQPRGDGNRSVGSKFQGSEMREERNSKRNYGERVGGGGGGTEYGNQKSDRQFNNRDNRENRPNPRFRNGGDRYGKREFDRQSGSDKTGIKAVDKRDGAGAHNWGSLKQEIEDIDKVANDIDVNGTDKDESANEQSAEQTVPPEEEVKEMTLDEWKALRQNRSKPQYNLRKAGEGEDNSQWKKMTILNKKKENDSEEEYEFDPSLYPQRVGRLQRITDIQFNFNDGRRGFGRGRGGGAGGPGRERGGGRFENRNQERPPRNFGERQQRKGGPSALKVDDEHQFPTLG